MAKTRILLLLSSILAAAAAAQLFPETEKSIVDLNIELQKITDVVVSAAPPEKQRETKHAAEKHAQLIESALDKAKESGDGKRITRIFFTVKMAAGMITAAPPDKKLRVMEDQFNSVFTPSLLDCPTVDKAYCELHSKVRNAVNGVVAAAPSDKVAEVQAAVLEKAMYGAGSTISKAYADGDEKKIAQVLAAYSKAADASGESKILSQGYAGAYPAYPVATPLADVVLAAAPTDKLKVMEKTFDAAAAGGKKD